MKQDCTDSQSTADETKQFQPTESIVFPKGKHVSEPDKATGPVVEKYTEANPIGYKPVTWCYLFMHHKKVKPFEDRLVEDNITYFIHKTIKYVPRHRNRNGMREVEAPSVSGLVFLQGTPKELQSYLDDRMLPYRLCKNCSTGEVATIPNNQMEPFMRVAESDPERLRFLLRPFVYYSKNRVLLRIITGDYAGLEGYVIRIARDRRLVMDVGGMAVAVSGVHAERFEEVGKNEGGKGDRANFHKRNLQERNAFIDRYFHQVRNSQEVAAQTENINILFFQTLADVRNRKLDMRDAFSTFYFMIEEIGYYYAPFADSFKANLKPVFDAGKKVMQEISRMTSRGSMYFDEDVRQRLETEYEELRVNYGYLFE